MSSIFNVAPIYITTAELTDSTSLSSVSALLDDPKTILINQAQDVIDSYIWLYGIPAIEWQANIFPTQDEDGNTEDIPLDIKKATVYICDQLYTNGNTTGWNISVWGLEIKSQKDGDSSIAYQDEDKANSNFMTPVLDMIPQEAINLLQKYKRDFYKYIPNAI